TMFGAAKLLFERDPDLKNDPRFKLYPAWMQAQVRTMGSGPDAPPGLGQMVVDVMRAGGVIVSGTDTPNAINLHAELAAYVKAGMSPAQRVKAGRGNPSRPPALAPARFEPGKPADLVVVDGDPLADITATRKVQRVIANGHVYEMNQLLNPHPTSATQ